MVNSENTRLPRIGGIRLLRTLRSSTRWHDGARAFAHDEDGSVTPFSLFIFMMMLFVGGMAVDLMRFETSRAAIQNTLDGATLAATNLRSDADAEALVNDILTKRGYDPNLANVTVVESYTGADPNDPNNRGTLVSRSVSANYDLDMNTIFMPLLGIDQIGTTAAGGAKEGMQSVEISLVLDISGSMGNDDRLVDLKAAAKNFIDDVVDPARPDLPVTLSIVPFNHTVKVPDSLLSRLNTNSQIDVPPSVLGKYNSYTGHLIKYDRTNTDSKCVRFYNNEMITTDLQETTDPSLNPNYLLLRAITQSQAVDRIQYYRDARYYGSPIWCDPSMPAILPYGTDVTTLKTYITNLSAGGATANDIGLKWGVALLDPAFRPVVSSMVSANILPAAIDGRPYDYNPSNFLKIVVLMTDGSNTQQFDVKSDYKNGPSRVWFSPNTATAAGNSEYGYFVLMPNNDQSQRFMQPRNLGTRCSRGSGSGCDAVLLSASSLPADAVQLSYTQLFSRFPDPNDMADLFYDRNYGDSTAYNNHKNAATEVIYNPDDGEADRRMSGNPSNSGTEFGICDAAKVKNDILIYTIAFKADSNAEAVMQDCATSPGYYFKASDKAALEQAFSAIAGSITTLRLTQ